MISQNFQMNLFEESDVWTLSREDFRAKLSALQEKEKVFQILEELSFLRLHASHLSCDLSFYTLKTSKDSSTMNEGLRLRRSSEPWMNWGMTWSGNCLTAKSLSPKTESVYLLSDILEEQVPKRFFLSQEKKDQLIKNQEIHLAGTTHAANDLSRFTRERTYYTDGLMGTLTATDYKTPKQIVVGNVNPSGGGMNGQVYDASGLSPTITTNKGEGNKIAIPILTPDKATIRQNGRRMKENEAPMFTLTTQDRHGIIVAGSIDGSYRSAAAIHSVEGLCPTLTTMSGGGHEPKILVKEATKKGYTAALPGDSINYAYPKSKKRRGRVGNQQANTVVTGDQQAVVTDDFQIRKLTPLECWRLQSFPDWAFLAAKFGNRQIAEEIISNGLDHYNCRYDQKTSDSQLYKQAGNSVTVSVIYFIAKHFKINDAKAFDRFSER